MRARWRALCTASQMLCLDGVERAEQRMVDLANAALSMAELPPLPEIVCLCGSTRHLAAFLDWQRILTLQGRVVLTIGCVLSGGVLSGPDGEDAPLKLQVDLLHRRKIDLADAVLVLDVDGYVGSSTQGELEYAEETGKKIIRLSVEYPQYEMPSLDQALLGTFAVRLDDNKAEVDRG